MNTQQIVPFQYQEHQVRVFLDANNEPLWVAADI